MPEEFDPARLAKFLKVLANPARLEILRRLNRPRTLPEIRVAPHRAEQGHVPTRPMSQVAVRKHLLQLLGIGVVQGMRLPRQGRATTHYQLSRPQMFALSEEFLAMVRLEGAEGLLEGTLLGPPSNLPGQPGGPHLVLVRGVEEGRSFPLEARPGRTWRIGRRAGSEVCLDYDGYLSQLNSRIRWDSGFVVEDVPGNRNGTRVNWAPLPPGGKRPLSPGDVVGVGRSLLLFRDR